LYYFLHQLGISHPATDLAEAQNQLTAVLEQNFSRGRQVVIAIDEAHRLRGATLRGTFELLDCPLAKSKDLRVVLAGLPSLKSKLASPALQQIRARISDFASLSPLTPEESSSYTKRFLQVSEHLDDQVFTDDAIRCIAGLANHIPGEINNICLALIHSAGKRACARVDAATVLYCASVEDWFKREPCTETAILDVPGFVETSHQQSESVFSDADAATDSNNLEPAIEERRESVQEASGSPAGASAKFAKLVSDWFGFDRIAWIGTIGELSNSLHQPEAELLRNLHVASDDLRTVGIALTITESSTATLLTLRALEERKDRQAESELGTQTLNESEQQLVEGEETGMSSAVNETRPDSLRDSEPSHAATNGPDDGLQSQTTTDEISDATLAFSNPPYVDHVVEAHAPRLPWVIVTVLVCAIAFVIAVSRHRLLIMPPSALGRQTQVKPPSSHSADVVSHAAFASKNRSERQDTRGKQRATSDLLQAARSGDPSAQFRIGAAYVEGDGVAADVLTGYTWLTVAFANGNKEAEPLIRELSRNLTESQIAQIRLKLGQMYAVGIGVRSDKVTAYMWDLLAEFSGEARGRFAISELDRTMTVDQKIEARARAVEWLRKHGQVARTGSLPLS
jgi:hypothetical protein